MSVDRKRQNVSSIGARSRDLRALRRQRGLSQKELAALVGRDQATISRWENNQSRITPQRWAALARVLGTAHTHGHRLPEILARKKNLVIIDSFGSILQGAAIARLLGLRLGELDGLTISDAFVDCSFTTFQRTQRLATNHKVTLVVDLNSRLVCEFVILAELFSYSLHLQPERLLYILEPAKVAKVEAQTFAQ